MLSGCHCPVTGKEEHFVVLGGQGLTPRKPNDVGDTLSQRAAVPAKKLHPPKAAERLIMRESLHARVRQWPAYKLTLITAPAGYGKTTLATMAFSDPQYVAGRPAQTAWLSLDDDDDVPVRFLLNLSVCLEPIIPEAAHAAGQLVMSQMDVRRALDILVVGLEALSDHVLVVLDDFQRANSDAVQSLFAIALERMPDNLHWMLLARDMLPIPLGKLRLDGQLLELGIEDLRLNSQEIETVLQTATGLHTDETTTELLAARTRGWPAGLHLLLLPLQQQAKGRGLSHDHVLHALLNQGPTVDSRFLMEYLKSEVLTELDASLRSFLLQCATLEYLHATLCTAVTGMTNSTALLDQAMTQQLFLSPIARDGAAGTATQSAGWYVFHQMFRELLLQQLRVELPSDQVQELYRRAADWHLAQGQVTTALHAFIDGGMPQEAADAVQARARQAVLANDLVDLRQWFNLLPTDEIAARPQLLLDQAWLVAAEDAAQLTKALAPLRTAHADSPHLTAEQRDELTVLEFLAAFFQDADREGLHQDIVDALAHLDPTHHLAYGWANVLAYFTAFLGQDPPLERYIREAGKSFAAIGYSSGQIRVFAMEFTMHRHNLNADAALDAWIRADQLSTAQPYPVPGDRLAIALWGGETLYFQDRIDEAAPHFRRVLEEATAYQDAVHSLLGIAAVEVCDLLEPPEHAVPLPALDESTLWHESVDGALLGGRAWIVLWQMRRSLLRGATHEVWPCFAKLGIDLETLPQDAPDNAWLALLTAYCTDGRQLADLMPAFNMLSARAQSMGSRMLTIQVQVQQIRQLQQMNQHNEARKLLRSVLAEVQRTGYTRLVLDYPQLAPLLRVIRSKFAQEMRRRMQAPPRNRQTKVEAGGSTAYSWSTREISLLQHLAQDHTNPEIAESLILTDATTRSYLSRLYRKLGVKDRAEAVVKARELGFGPPASR